jgi:hypothetical protein
MNEQVTSTPAETPSRREWARRVAGLPRVRLGAVIALALAAGIVAWAVAGRTSSSKTSTAATPVGPVALSASGLATLARTVGQPIYWAGPRKGYLYELRRTSNGNVYIRYLPPGVDAGAPGAKYLTIATYPYPGALRALKNVTDGRHVSIPGGGIGVIGSTYKKSVHLAYPNVDYQVEVFDPSAARALAVATSGRVKPAG